MRLRNVLAAFIIVIATTSTWFPVAFALPPLENNMVFPAGTFVVPMDETQAERILVFGYVHALLRSPNPIQIFRVIEPPNVTLSTNMTASPKTFTGGPFLVLPSDASKIAAMKNKPEFKKVTVGTLTSQHTLNNIFRVTDPTKILVVKGEPAWGRTDITLDAMRIPYNLTTHAALTANPNMIFSYSLIVVDCAGWNGLIPSQIADNIRAHVNAGNEVIFTDRALKDMDTTFPGYVNVSGAQPTDKVSDSYAYNPPRKYDPAKYGSSADRFVPEYPSQYYNPAPRPNEIKVFTESQGYVVSSVPAARVNDVRILTDTKKFGPASNQYAILAFYFEYGDGVVEGLAFHPQQQVKSTVGDKGYYAVYQWYGNKFVHGPPPKAFSLEASPTSISTPQGTSVTYTITVRSFGTFSSPVTLGVSSGMPSGASYVFNPPAPQPPAGGIAASAFTVTVPLSTPVGSYAMNVTGISATPSIQKWVVVTLNVTLAPADFQISVSPNSLTINTTESKSALVIVTSIGTFSQNVTLNVTGLPAHVTATFAPSAPKPLTGGTASSIMRINVGADAVNGTYPLTIVGSNGTTTRSAPFTLVIVKKPAPGIPLLTMLFILALALLGIALALVAVAASSRRRKRLPPVVGPVVAAPRRAERLYVVPTAAQRVRCPHCGKPLAVEAVYCPYCGHKRTAAGPRGIVSPGSTSRPTFTGRRAVWGFILATTSAILILLNAAALLSAGFWGPPTNWSAIFWWLVGPSGLGQSLATLIGVIAGFTVMTGGIMMIMKRGVTGALITFPFAMLSIIIGGGFVAGAVLGIAAGVLGAVGR
jgi:hypothetical protein